MPVYKDEQRGTWYFKCNYRDWQGETRTKLKRGFATKREAQQGEREFLDMQSGNMNMKLSAFAEVYFNDKGTRLKERSIMTKRTLIETKIIPYFGEKSMNEITAVDIIKWQNLLMKQEYSPTYLRMIQNQLTALFNHAERFYDLRDNPCKKVDKMGRSNAKELNFWTKDEYEVFLETFAEGDEMYRLIFQMLFWLGCRIGEALALTSSDIDVEKATISVTKTYYRRNKTDYITSPKTESSNRKITIPKFLQGEIKEYLDRQYELAPDERIFPITDRAVQKKMKQKTEEAKLKPIRVHDLRHSHIALLIEKGLQPLVIAQRVGHDSVNTTMNIYGHLYPNKQKEVADLLNAEATGELENNLVDMATEMRFRKAGGWS
ncbi:MAG: site-specific integrase [Lachnospiraceae bacterium]|nr:site-specific integrase [Lachnospiraceae bacterium]